MNFSSRQGETPVEPLSRCGYLLHGSAGASPSRTVCVDSIFSISCKILTAAGIDIQETLDGGTDDASEFDAAAARCV